MTMTRKNEEKGAFATHYRLGLTKREYTAIKMMQGVIANERFMNSNDYQQKESVPMYIQRQVSNSIKIADELLKQLDNK